RLTSGHGVRYGFINGLPGFVTIEQGILQTTALESRMGIARMKLTAMRKAAEQVFQRTSLRPRVGVVLGSGLGAFAESLLHTARIPYRDVPGLPVSTAIGHAGELVLGTLGANGAGTID